MKLFIKSILTFIPFLMVTYIALIFVWGNFVPPKFQKNLKYRIGANGHLFSRLEEAEQTKNVDLLILGSSHAYREFDTRIFEKNGLSTFNLGSSAQTPIQTQTLLDRYLDELNPELILFEVYPAIFTLDGVESSLDVISNGENDLASLEMAIDINHIKVYNTLIYGLTMDLLNLNSSYEEHENKEGDTYISGGYVEKEIEYFKDNVCHPSKEWEFNESQFEEFAEIIELFNERNIDIVLVQAPITSSLYNSYENNAEFDSLMSNFGLYYNFNEMLDLSDSLHFYDSDHLNQNGVEIFNRELVSVLKD